MKAKKKLTKVSQTDSTTDDVFSCCKFNYQLAKSAVVISAVGAVIKTFAVIDSRRNNIDVTATC